jgi:hypothetical protein
MAIHGWIASSPSDFPTPAEHGDRVTLIPAEVCYCQDDNPTFLASAMQNKWRKYQSLPPLRPLAQADDHPSSLLGRDLLLEFRAQGWRVLG